MAVLTHEDWTAERVKAVQRSLGVTVDGKVGPDTAFGALGLVETLDAPRQSGLVTDLPWAEGEYVHGFDTSGHQSPLMLDLHGAARSQAFHIVKVTEGDFYYFREARQRIEASRELGMLTGEYHFFRPSDGWKGNFAMWEAHSCWQKGDLPPMIDAEKGRRRKIGNNRFRPASRVQAEANFADLLSMGMAVADKLGVKPLVYFTRPSWGWHFRPAGELLKSRLGEVYDIVLADYVRDSRGRISPEIALMDDFDHDDLAAMRRSGLTGRVVAWQWTGKGRTPWYDGGKSNIDRCVMHRGYLAEVCA